MNNWHHVFRFLAAACAETPTRLEDGSVMLLHAPQVARMLRLLELVGVLAILGGIVAAFWMRGLLVVSLLGLLGRYVARRELRVAVLLDDRGVAVRAADGSHAMVAWSDVTRLRLRRRDWTWLLDGGGGASLRFPALLKGGLEFPRELRRHVASAQWKRCSDAVDLYYRTLRGFGIKTFRSRREAEGDEADEQRA